MLGGRAGDLRVGASRRPACLRVGGRGISEERGAGVSPRGWTRHLWGRAGPIAVGSRVGDTLECLASALLGMMMRQMTALYSVGTMRMSVPPQGSQHVLDP